MSFVWFCAAIVFGVLWWNARSSNDSEGAPPSTDAYAQGYWDGYRAFGSKISALLRKGVPSKQDLSRLVDEGQGVNHDGAQGHREAVAEIIHEDTSSFAESGVQPVISAKELQAQKDKDTLRNLNILLYVGSFLIVAAAALFVTLVMPASVKLTCLIGVVLAFYGSGMVLHARSERLRPAALAFVGTGLAILPFVGFALTALGSVSGQAAWFVTSCVGLVAYGLAALRLQSELISYLSMAFVLSLALSSVSTLGMSMMWYFIVLMGVALVCSCAAILWPRQLPQSFVRAVTQTGRLTTPVALGASMLVMADADLLMYEVLFACAAAQYAIEWVLTRTWPREMAVRVLLHAFALLMVADVLTRSGANGSDFQFVGVLAASLAAALQAAYSVLRSAHKVAAANVMEQIWIGAGILAMVCLLPFWWTASHPSWWVTISLSVIGVLATAAAARFRYLAWVYVALAVTAILPFYVGRVVLDSAVSFEVIAGLFIIVSLSALLVIDALKVKHRSRQLIATAGVASGGYALLAVVAALLSEHTTTLGWVTACAAALFVCVSYVLRGASMLQAIAVVLGVWSVASWTSLSSVPAEWQVTMSVILSMVLFLATAYVHHRLTEYDRRDGMILAAMLMSVGVVVPGMQVHTTMVDQLGIIILLAAGVAGAAARTFTHRPDSTITALTHVAYLGYPILALFAAGVSSIAHTSGWVALIAAVYAGILWFGSYRERQPGLQIAGNVLLLVAVIALWEWLALGDVWRIHGVAWILSVVFYLWYWFNRDKKDEARAQLNLVSLWIVLVGSGMSAITGGSDVAMILAGAGSLVMLALTTALYGRERGKEGVLLIEISIYIATFALQRAIESIMPALNIVWYAHWWALTIAGVAYWRRDNSLKVRMILALGLVTASTGLFALSGESGYAMIFLVEHLLVLVAGAQLRTSWVLWWGVVAVVAGVVYFLREYTFAAPLFMGVLLIVFVVWRLSKTGKKE